MATGSSGQGSAVLAANNGLPSALAWRTALAASSAAVRTSSLSSFTPHRRNAATAEVARVRSAASGPATSHAAGSALATRCGEKL